MSQDHNDIYSIVERLAILEGRITPDGVKKGLNPQQRSVPQMPALFKPKTQKILGGDANAKNPMSGFAVGGCEESVNEDNVAEDTLTKVKQSFNDYLQSIEDRVRKDTDLKDKIEVDHELRKKEIKDRDLIAKEPKEEVEESAPIKTITNECGLWEVHGDEKTGFEIRHGNRPLKSKFKSLDDAEMALEMFQARMAAKKKADDSADYVEEN
jgi:hypothetical protein